MDYIHSHDGAADDQLATVMLLNMNLNLIAVCVTPADSYYETAVKMTKKLYNGPIIINNNIFDNNFPKSWRDETYDICRLMDAEEIELPHVSDDVVECMKLIDIIQNSKNSITFIETGTMNLLAKCLKLDPSIGNKITNVIWTAGSQTIAKSPPPGCDGTQTWNCYIDSKSAQYVFENTNMEIVLFTREVTDKVKLTREFLDMLPDTYYGNLFRKVYSYYVEQEFYRLWDVMTATYPLTSKLFQFEYIHMQIITHGESEGKTEISNNGRFVKFLKDVDPQKIYNFIVEMLK